MCVCLATIQQDEFPIKVPRGLIASAQHWALDLPGSQWTRPACDTVHPGGGLHGPGAEANVQSVRRATSCHWRLWHLPAREAEAAAQGAPPWQWDGSGARMEAWARAEAPPVQLRGAWWQGVAWCR